MRKYGNSYAEAVADTAPYTPLDAKNADSYLSAVYSDTLLDGVSAVVPSGARPRLVLDYRPVRTTLTATLNGVPAAITEFGPAVSTAGTVAIDWVSGAVEFHASDSGKTPAFQYKHYGTVLDAHAFNKLQKAVGGSQPLDSDLTALAGLTTTGILARTGSGTAATRTLSAGAGISVTNGNGVSGNPTVAVNSNVARRDQANTFTQAQTLPALVVGRVSMPSASNVYANAGSVAYSIDVNDGWVQYWSTTGNTATLTLPPLASVTDGHIVFLFQAPTGSGTSTLKGDGSDNVDTGTTFSNTATLSNSGFSLYLCRAELGNTRWRLIKIA